MPRHNCLGGTAGAGLGSHAADDVEPGRKTVQPDQQAALSKSVVTYPYEVSPQCKATRFLSAPAGQGPWQTWRLTKTTKASWPVPVK
ncbi:hypothetical protein SRHO_G00157460 [Serrasalmus rhombeus]